MKNILIVSILWLYGGCSESKLSIQKINIETKTKKSSCEEKAKPKSLQFLEQQYHCQSQN